MCEFGSSSLGIVVQNGQRLYAVVQDLDRHLSCDKRVVRKALLGIVRICNEGDIHSIAIEPLGCVHGTLESEWFLKQLWEVAATSSLRHIWVYD